MGDFRTLDDIDVAGKRVLLRADLNVPMSGGRVSDTTRLDVRSREKAVATQAARMIMEEIRVTPFNDVLAEFNTDSADDPGGAGTGRGSTPGSSSSPTICAVSPPGSAPTWRQSRPIVCAGSISRAPSRVTASRSA